ncbi:hypothetical protein D3H64_09110 [Atopobacter sp. AH10]|nr:hypothetical protein D3H64_09110 [Atopobacter sp. AH10]
MELYFLCSLPIELQIGLKEIRRNGCIMTFKLWRKLVSQSIQEMLIDRKSAALVFLIGILFFGVEIIAGVVFFEQTETILNWTKTDYLLLVSTASSISFMYQTLFVISHENLTEYILEGELEPFLLKPVNSLLYFVLNRIDVSSFFNWLICLGVQVYFIQNYSMSVLRLVLFAFTMLLAVILIFILNQLAVSLSFWVEDADSILGVPEYLVEFSSRPMVIYPKGIRFFFTWFVPILMGLNLPVLIAKGDSYQTYLLLLMALDSLGLLAVYYVWKAGLKRYVSAN